MTLSELVDHYAIIPQLQAPQRDAAVRELMAALVAAGALDADLAEPLAKAAIDRENKGSTGFGKGIAIPHVKDARITKAVAAIGISPQGIDFRSLDGQPVHSVVLLLSPDNPEQHLAAMNAIWPNLNNDRFRKFLRQSKTREDIVELLEEAPGM